MVEDRWYSSTSYNIRLTLLWMGGRFNIPKTFLKRAILPAIVEPHGNQTLPPLCPVFRPGGSKSASHKAKGAYSDLKFRALKAHPI